MTWSSPEGPVERNTAPNVGSRPSDEARDARAGAPEPERHDVGRPAPLFATPGFSTPGTSTPGTPTPGTPMPGTPATGAPALGPTPAAQAYPGHASAAAGASPQHLAYPVTPYVQAPYTAPRPSTPGALTLSIVALCLSGGSFLVALIPVLQFVWWMVGIAGIVCGFIALRREPRGRALAVTSIVLGFISVFGLLLLIVLALLFFGGIGLLGGFSSY